MNMMHWATRFIRRVVEVEARSTVSWASIAWSRIALIKILLRNDAPDQGLSAAEAIRNRAYGNGVVTDHEAGWQTQYCHLRDRPVVVVPGQTVGVATVLGQVVDRPRRIQTGRITQTYFSVL